MEAEAYGTNNKQNVFIKINWFFQTSSEISLATQLKLQQSLRENHFPPHLLNCMERCLSRNTGVLKVGCLSTVLHYMVQTSLEVDRSHLV